MATRMNVDPPQFEDILNWLRDYDEQNPKHIHKLGNRSSCPYFRAWADGPAIQLRAHPDAPNREHLLTFQEWEAFRAFRNGLADDLKDKASAYADHPWCLNRFFYPAIPAISWAYLNEMH
jgi:hypothetical protein